MTNVSEVFSMLKSAAPLPTNIHAQSLQPVGSLSWTATAYKVLSNAKTYTSTIVQPSCNTAFALVWNLCRVPNDPLSALVTQQDEELTITLSGLDASTTQAVSGAPDQTSGNVVANASTCTGKLSFEATVTVFGLQMLTVHEGGVCTKEDIWRLHE
jgi:hypothetical protein